MMAANSKNNLSPAENEDPSGGGTNWFVSIGLSVSQLFTGSGAAAAQAPNASLAATGGQCTK